MKYQGGLFRARSTDPLTSHLSASMIWRDLNNLEQKVLRAMEALGEATDLDINNYCDEKFGIRKESSYRKRRGELLAKGLIADTSKIKRQDGSARKVWRLTTLGKNCVG